jgi:hypothetical protein
MPEQDWVFDVGYNTDGKVVVEAFASTIPDKRMRLTREQLIELRDAIDAAQLRYPKGILRGTQIVYVPEHAGGNLNHPTCETGFVLAIRDGTAWCRYWSKYAPGELRTKSCCERTPVELLVAKDTVPQRKVDAWLAAYELGYEDVRQRRPERAGWTNEVVRDAYLSGRDTAETDRALRQWPEWGA